MKNEIKCTNDTLFKYLLLKSDQLRKIIILHTTQIIYDKITILNPNLLPDHAYEKNIYLDMALVDNNGNHFNIEMQAGKMTPGAVERFQYYLARDVSDELEIGDDYTKLAPCFQIVFIQDTRKTDQLIEHYTMRSDSRELEGNIFHLIFVHLPNIMRKAKTMGLEQLNIFERIVYAFQTDLSHDIINLQDEVILEMYEHKKKYNIEEEEARLWERAKKFQQYYEKRLMKEAEEAKSQLINTKVALETTKEELDTTMGKLDTAKTELDTTKTELDTTKTELDTTKTELDTAKTELDTAKTELDTAKTELDTAKTELDTAKAELDTAKAELDNTKSKLDSITESLKISIENIMSKFNCSYDEAIDILGLKKSDISL